MKIRVWIKAKARMKFLVLALVSGCVLSGCAWGGAEEKQDEREQDIEENSGEGQALGKEDVSGEGQTEGEGQDTELSGRASGSNGWPENMIEEQSFEVELDGWGRAMFVSASPENGKGEPSFFLLKGGEKVYTFPEKAAQKSDEFVEVSAVSFTD